MTFENTITAVAELMVKNGVNSDTVAKVVYAVVDTDTAHRKSEAVRRIEDAAMARKSFLATVIGVVSPLPEEFGPRVKV